MMKQARFKLRNMLSAGLITAFLLLSSVSNIFAYSADVEDISSRDYFPKVKEVIDNAEKSIHMSMFVVSLRPNQKNSVVYKLCDALIDAKKRGVMVRVILDQNVNYYDNKKKGEIEGKNTEAYQYLTKNGIEVFYDNKYEYTHSKALVIDEKIVIIGSTNWSYSAIERNNESSAIIMSPELAKKIIEGFSKIEVEKIVKEIPFNIESAIKIYKTFLEDKELAGRMITKHDERAFDLYLLLLYENEGKKKISFDFDLYAKYLGIDYMKPTAYRRQLSKSLRKLNEVYSLLNVEFRHGHNAIVKLLDIEDESKSYQKPADDYFMLPEGYFKYGWNKELSQRAKHCYMINLYMSQEGDGNTWSVSRDDIGEIFNLEIQTISYGMNELRSKNLIDIEYSSIEKGYENRAPAKYRLLELYDPVENEKAIQKLKEKYSDEFKTARKYAKVVFKENDPVVIEEIINLIQEYPDDIIKKAYKKVGKKAKDNPKRNQRYAVAVIRDQGGK